MFGLMTVKAHRDEMEKILHRMREAARLLYAERSISANLRAEIEAMKPIYELGKKRRAAYDRNNADRKAKRKAAKAIPANRPPCEDRKAV